MFQSPNQQPLPSSSSTQQQESIQIKKLSSQIVQKKYYHKNIKPYQDNQPSTHLYNKKKHMHGNHNQKFNISSNNDKQQQNIQLQQLDVSDMLKTISHQKKCLTQKRKSQLIRIHHQSKISNDDYKHFIMVASQVNYRKLQHPGYYAQLLKQIQNYPPLFFACIDKDLPRTLKANHPLYQSLKNILYVYAIRNPSLLYCQGMNYIVSFLLINKFNQQQTFWLIVRLIQDITMTDYFKDLTTISIAVQIFSDIIPDIFPKLHQQMQAVGMQSGIFLVGWFICLFTKGFINSVSQYLLQQIILSSYQYSIGFILIKISISLFAILFTRDQSFQFQQKDFKSLKQTIQSSTYQISLSQLKQGIDFYQFDYSSFKQLQQLYIKKHQKIYPQALEQLLRGYNLLPPCDIHLPVCIQRVEIEKKVGKVQEVLILKNNIPIQNQLIYNYFPHNINRSQGKIIYENSDECLITHHKHICNKQKILPRQLKKQTQKYCPKQQEGSTQVKLHLSKVQDVYSSYSSYFKTSNQSLSNNSITFDLSAQQAQNLMAISDMNEQQDQQSGLQKIQINTKPSDITFLSTIGNTLKKVFDGINLLKDHNYPHNSSKSANSHLSQP